VRVGANVPLIGAGVVGGPFITPFWQLACAKHCSPGGLSVNVTMTTILSPKDEPK
jgi:hypothetical protein